MITVKEIIDINEVDINKDCSIIYIDPLNAKLVAANLLGFGASLFNRAERVKNFEIFESLNTRERPPFEKLEPFAMENTVDIFRIITCFENYMKSILLINGYVVHLIKSNDTKYDHLRLMQRKMPVYLKDVRGIEDFIQSPNEKVKSLLSGIENKTITMGTMLKTRYQQVIKLPASVYKTIEEYNAYRNKLHFYVQENLHISTFEVNKLEGIRDFVSENVTGLHHKLVNELEHMKVPQDESFYGKKNGVEFFSD
jgi:hypothetical protein